ncbi:MAG: dockerin type I repeat-containing protein [Candidatus Zixiibacteriota bacterium]
MKLIMTGVVLIALIFAGVSAATNVDQVGSAASGRSSSGTLRLESVLGQVVSGSAGRLTSGFYSGQVIPSYLAGDVDGDGMITISDAVFLINFIFAGGQPPQNPASADADCNDIVTISDAVFMINYIFSGGAAPQPCG